MRKNVNHNNIAASVFLGSMVVVLLTVAALIGWFSNLYWLFTTEVIGNEFWLALAGALVAPVGIIHGWIVLF
jgi:hypothetical protein